MRGKAHADLGDTERSFRHLLDGNALWHKRAKRAMSTWGSALN
jgi:hypothetical protein